MSWTALVGIAAAASAVAAQPAAGQAGRFDYYLMTLSWSPQYCAGKPGDSVQCGGPRRFGFVLHGLWPQYEKGYPQSCQTSEKLDAATAKAMLDIMPSDQLIRHEWQKHGVCDGSTAKDYFAKARQAFNEFKTPPRFQQPTRQVMVKPADFKKQVLESNAWLKADQVAVLCSGRYFQEIRLCLTKDLRGRACSSQVRDRCGAPEMIVRPVR
ncbi:MAG: ribonuclease T2 [Bryobacterales bacterium]|nr:ribonuclease T2 [Bryobacterales bacterium]